MEAVRRTRALKEPVGRMENVCGTWLMSLLIGVVLWTVCPAAPTLCHFNSRALCEYEGRRYTLGETWMERGCLQCTCLHPVGVGCCETLHRPVDFPPWCEVRVELLTCKVTLVQVADPRVPCSPGDDDNSLDPRHGGSPLGM